MKKVRGMMAILFLAIPFFSIAAKPTIKDWKDLPEDITFWSNYPDELLARAITERMSDEELLSQMFMFGWTGVLPGSNLQSWVSDIGLGSIKIFGWNTENLKNVAKSVSLLQELAQKRRFQIPLFVATDQEGGWIRHVKGATSETPGNMAIGASGYLSDSYYSSYYINKEINVLGINMNFAPTVDLYTNLDSTIIGPRSFGADPEIAGRLGEAFALGSQAAGVIPTAKHFPGHGDTDIDSHGRLPTINIDRKTFDERELIPFKYLIQAEIPAIMSGHLSYPQIDPSGAPASLSKIMLTDILRNELGYKGLIITDDMMMNGSTMYAGSVNRAVTMAIQAGNDIIMSSTAASQTTGYWVDNLSLMKTNGAFKNTVKDHVYNILLAKLKYFKGSKAAPLFPDDSKIEESIPDPEGQKFFLDQACRSVTLYNGTLPYKAASGEKILLLGVYREFFEEGRKRFPKAQTMSLSNYATAAASDDENGEGARSSNPYAGYDVVIVEVYNESSARAALALKRLNCKVIVISSLTPVPVLNFDWADIVLLGYSYSRYSYQAMFAALCGDFKPSGVLPLDVKKQ